MADVYRLPGCTGIKATPKALLVRAPVGEGGKLIDVWVPQNCIHDDSDVWKEGHTGKLVVYSWFVERQPWGRAL